MLVAGFVTLRTRAIDILRQAILLKG